MFRFVKNQKGLTLMELMISVVLVSLLIYGVSELVGLSTRITGKVKGKVDLQSLRSELRNRFKSGSLCSRLLTTSGPWRTGAVPASIDTSLFGTAHPPTIELEHILNDADPANGTFLAKNTLVPHMMNIRVKKIELRDIIGLEPSFTARLYVEFEQPSGESVRPIHVTLPLVASGPTAVKTISSCTDGSKAGTIAAEFRDSINPSSFTVPPNVYKVRVTVTGGGGGGAAGSQSSSISDRTCLGGGGGGGGGTAICLVDVSPGTTIPVTIGQGGASGGGPTGFASASGGDGQDTAFGALCVGQGGKGGTVGAVANTIAASTLSRGGLGGSASGTGSLAIVNGEPGPDGSILDNCFVASDETKNKSISGAPYGGSSLRGFSIGQGGHGGNGFANATYHDALGGKGTAGAVLIEYLQP